MLGICYGQQLMAHLLGGTVEKGERGEYGFAQLDLRPTDSLFRGIDGPPAGLDEPSRPGRRSPRRASTCWRSTDTCAVAAMAAPERGLYGVQFHPEVAHTPCGTQILSNFVFDVCGCVQDWDPAGPGRSHRGSDPRSRRGTATSSSS